MSSAGWIAFSKFQHGLQDGYLSLNPHVKGRLFPLNFDKPLFPWSMCAAPDGVPTTHQWPGKGDGECFHFKSSECVLWINELSYNNWRILSTNGYNLCPSPVAFVNLSFFSLYDEHLWRSDERFCLWRLLCSLTKGYAEWPIGVQSILLICQPVMNTADGL